MRLRGMGKGEPIFHDASNFTSRDRATFERAKPANPRPKPPIPDDTTASASLRSSRSSKTSTSQSGGSKADTASPPRAIQVQKLHFELFRSCNVNSASPDTLLRKLRAAGCGLSEAAMERVAWRIAQHQGQYQSWDDLLLHLRLDGQLDSQMEGPLEGQLEGPSASTEAEEVVSCLRRQYVRCEVPERRRAGAPGRDELRLARKAVGQLQAQIGRVSLEAARLQGELEQAHQVVAELQWEVKGIAAKWWRRWCGRVRDRTSRVSL